MGSARAAFNGTVVAHNEALLVKPERLADPFGEGWMLIVRPAREDWRTGLVTGQAIGPAFAAWIAAEGYKAHTFDE